MISLRGRGLPRLRGGPRGDIHYAISVEVPRKLNAKQRELLESFAKESGDEVSPRRRGFLDALRDLFDLSPRGIRTHLKLNRPIYGPSAAYGHFGRTPTEDGGFSWERTDLVDELRSLVS